MRCHNCGAELAEAASFCCFCGSQLSAPQNPEAPEAACEAPEVIIEEPAPVPAPAAQRKKKPVALIVAACIAAVLAVVVVLGLCTNWFGLYGPGTRIAVAAKNTLEKGNLTIAMSTRTEASGLSSLSIIENETIIQIDIDPENREITLYGKSQQQHSNRPYTSYIGIIDGYSITGYRYSDFQHFTKTDISEELEEFFDAYEDTKDMDWDDLFDLIEEKTGEDLEEYIDIKSFKKCLRTYSRSLNSNKWLKENAGYSTYTEDGVRYYEFEPNLYTFSKTSLEMFEDAFRDEDDYEDIMDSLKSSRKEISDFDVEIAIGVRRNQLAEMHLDIDADAIVMDCTLEFQDIGTTELPIYILEEMLMQAN